MGSGVPAIASPLLVHISDASFVIPLGLPSMPGDQRHVEQNHKGKIIRANDIPANPVGILSYRLGTSDACS